MGIENPVNPESKDRLVRYWLGNLPDAEKLRLEKECLADDHLAESLKEAENDLLDAYVCEELSEEQRMLFEQNYLDSPEKHRQIELVRLLMNPAVRLQIADTAIPIQMEGRSWWPWGASFFKLPAVRLATVAAGMAIVAVVLILVVQNHRLRVQLDGLVSEQTKLHQQIAELQRNANATNAAVRPTGDGLDAEKVIVSALLKPGLIRQAGNINGNPPLSIPASASSVVLLLDLANNGYSRYSAVLETVEGKTIHQFQTLSSKPARGGPIVALPLPAQALPRGDYIVTLSGAKPNKPSQVVDSYTFSVSR